MHISCCRLEKRAFQGFGSNILKDGTLGGETIRQTRPGPCMYRSDGSGRQGSDEPLDSIDGRRRRFLVQGSF